MKWCCPCYLFSLPFGQSICVCWREVECLSWEQLVAVSVLDSMCSNSNNGKLPVGKKTKDSTDISEMWEGNIYSHLETPQKFLSHTNKGPRQNLSPQCKAQTINQQHQVCLSTGKRLSLLKQGAFNNIIMAALIHACTATLLPTTTVLTYIFKLFFQCHAIMWQALCTYQGVSVGQSIPNQVLYDLVGGCPLPWQDGPGHGKGCHWR